MKFRLVISLLFLAPLAFSQNNETQWTQELDARIETLMHTYKIVGAGVAIEDPNGTALQKTYGYAQLESNKEATQHTLFRIASISKVLTAFAIMQLNEAGQVDLDQKITHYLPDFTPQKMHTGRDITVRDLLSHTSGLTDDINMGSYCESVTSLQCIIPILNEEVLSIPPGLTKNYSNAGYALLGCLIERQSGQSYETYIQEHIFNPLKMHHSTFAPSDFSVIASGYGKDSIAGSNFMIRDLSAGGAYTSLEDLHALTKCIQNNGAPLISVEQFARMRSNQLDKILLQTDEQFGLGLFIKYLGTDHDHIIGPGFGHAGDLRNHHALIMCYPEIPLSLSIATNSEQGARFANALAIEIIRQYFKIVKNETVGKNTEKEFSPIALEADRLDHDQIAGTYGGGGEAYIRIKNKSKHKLRFIQDGNVLVLKRTSNNTYQTRFLLFKLIPIPVKDLSFAFKETAGTVYMKTLMNKSKTGMYISRKDPEEALPPEWLNAQGPYVPKQDFSSCDIVVPYYLKCIENKIVLYRAGKKEDEQDEIGFNALSSTLAAADGIERGAGATLKILPNGNLYFSGFELRPRTTNQTSLKENQPPGSTK
jgi:CubicO group peptidase (beta-lactamase class C family)